MLPPPYLHPEIYKVGKCGSFISPFLMYQSRPQLKFMTRQIGRRRDYGRGTLIGAASRAARGVAPYLSTAAAAGLGALRARMNRKTSVPSIISNQHDVSNRYQRRRMPKGRRKKWVNFTRRVQHVELQQQPLQVYTKSTHASGGTAAGAGSNYGFMCGGTTVTSNDELFQIFKGAYNVANAAACSPYRIFVKSLCLDMILSNTGTSVIIFDVYRLACRQTYGSASSLSTQFSQAVGEVQADSTAGTLSVTDVAVTPFDVPNFCSYWKVLSKREVIVGPGNVSTMQIRMAKNRHLEGKTLATAPQAIPGYTEAFFITWHGAPNSTPTWAATSLTISTTTSIHYAIPPGKVTEAGRTG